MHAYSVSSHLDGICDGREKRKSDKAAARNKKAEDEKREKEEAAAAAAAQEAMAAEAAVEARKLRQVEKKAMQKQRSKLRTLSASLISSECLCLLLCDRCVGQVHLNASTQFTRSIMLNLSETC